jgi:predicted RNase H-like HicB family nuclease
MKTHSINNVVWKEGEHFVAQCLNADVSSFGDTKQEALTNLKEALELYFEDEDEKKFIAIEQPELIHEEITHA